MLVHHGGPPVLLMRQELEGGGRKKGRSVRGKVEETLTRRSAETGRNGDARVGYFEIPWAGCRGEEATATAVETTTPRKKRAWRLVTEPTSKGGRGMVL